MLNSNCSMVLILKHMRIICVFMFVYLYEYMNIVNHSISIAYDMVLKHTNHLILYMSCIQYILCLCSLSKGHSKDCPWYMKGWSYHMTHIIFHIWYIQQYYMHIWLSRYSYSFSFVIEIQYMISFLSYGYVTVYIVYSNNTFIHV